MLDLTYRSTEPELMDSPTLNPVKLHAALRDVSKVNRLLGGNHITIHEVFKRLKVLKNIKPVKIMDFGCGDGEILRKIAKRARKENIQLELIGLDINRKCLEQAKHLSKTFPEIQYQNENFFKLQKEENLDIIMTTLTTHHLNTHEFQQFLVRATDLVSDSVIINDLHRSKAAYYLFKLFSSCFLKSRVARHDGLVSIKRGFKRTELKQILREQNIHNYHLEWRWAFRYCLCIQNNQAK